MKNKHYQADNFTEVKVLLSLNKEENSLTLLRLAKSYNEFTIQWKVYFHIIYLLEAKDYDGMFVL